MAEIIYAYWIGGTFCKSKKGVFLYNIKTFRGFQKAFIWKIIYAHFRVHSSHVLKRGFYEKLITENIILVKVFLFLPDYGDKCFQDGSFSRGKYNIYLVLNI